MFYCDRIDVSEGIHLNKTNALKKGYEMITKC